MKREKLSSYTERAIRATEAGKLIPPIVYLPRLLRSKSVLIQTDLPTSPAMKIEAPSIEGNVVRIKEADPLGFLIAVMHGQPIPEFRINDTGNISMFYAVPKLQERMRAAEWMAATLRGASLRGAKLGAIKGGASGNTDDEADHAAMIAARGNNEDVVKTPNDDNV